MLIHMKKEPKTLKGRVLLKIKKVVLVIGLFPIFYIVIWFILSFFLQVTGLNALVSSEIKESFDLLVMMSALWGLPSLFLMLILLIFINELYRKVEREYIEAGPKTMV